MSSEAMKLALEALKELVAQTETGLFAVRHDHVAMQDARQAITILREALAEQPARPYRLLQDNGSKYFGDSWDKAEQPAQQEQEPICKLFGTLPVYDRAAQQALDKMAENARELGLDYEHPTQYWRAYASDYERGVIDGMQKQMQSSVDRAVNAMAGQPAQQNSVAWAHKHINATLAAFGPDEAISMTQDTWAKLREAMSVLIEQPAQQEPVAWMHEWEDGERIPMLTGRDDRNTDEPISVRPLVYADTSPPAQRKPLTDEQTKLLWHKARLCIGPRWMVFKRLIEAAYGIKEKNT